MELIEGDTLGDRIKNGPIRVEESLKLALQISEALEAAHEKGVIHRDLKPANIKITPDGKVKVLDFGLAKAFAGEQAEVNLSQSPTLSAAATQQGIILGTAAYMSPEQARGNSVDKRSDTWAFGVVLFEMLTGRSIFLEDTVSDTLASVLKSEPDWQSLPPDLHPRIRLLFERCLEKDPRDRYGSISDARVDVQKVLADRNGIFSPTGSEDKPQAGLRTIFPWAASFLIIGAMLASIAIWNLRTPVQHQPIHFTDELPYGLQFGELGRDAVLAVSPDSSKIVYSTVDGLYLRSLRGLNPKLIPGTQENVAAPFFSPDGRWIAYQANEIGRNEVYV